MSGIFYDGTTTIEVTEIDEVENAIRNSNSVVTLGGVVKTQADSQRLKIAITMRLSQDEHRLLSLVLNNYTSQLYYTPSRKLYDKASITALPVIITSPLTIDERVWDGCNVVFYDSIELEEVI